MKGGRSGHRPKASGGASRERVPAMAISPVAPRPAQRDAEPMLTSSKALGASDAWRRTPAAPPGRIGGGRRDGGRDLTNGCLAIDAQSGCLARCTTAQAIRAHLLSAVRQMTPRIPLGGTEASAVVDAPAPSSATARTCRARSARGMKDVYHDSGRWAAGVDDDDETRTCPVVVHR